MFCTKCGRELDATARFCAQCGATTGVAPSPDAAPRRLFRLSTDKKIAGVCSGLAQYLDVDVSFLRILTVAVMIFTAVLPVTLAYIVAWIIVPQQPLPKAPVAEPVVV